METGNGRKFLFWLVGVQTTVVLVLGGAVYKSVVDQINDLRRDQQNSLAAKTAAQLEERTSIWVPVIRGNSEAVLALNNRLTRLETEVELNRRRIKGLDPR